MNKVSFIVATIIVLASCAPKTTEVFTKAESSEFPNADVAQGNTLYVEHCGKCHKLKTVTDFTSDQWKKIVPNMSAKAKIDATMENKILHYVLWKTEKTD